MHFHQTISTPVAANSTAIKTNPVITPLQRWVMTLMLLLMASGPFSALAQELTLSKEFLTPAPPGESTDLRFTIENNTDQLITDIAFTDDLDATLSGLQVAGPIPLLPCGLGSSVSGSSLISFAGGAVSADDVCSFTLQVQVPAEATPGVYVNTTSNITGTIGSEVASGVPASDTLFAILGPAMLKQFDALTIDDGGTVELTFTLANQNPTLDAQDVSFDDDLEAFLPGTTATPTLQTDVCGTGSSLTAVDSGSGVVLELRDAVLPAAIAGITDCTFSITLQLPGDIAPGVYVNRTTPITANLAGGASPLAVEGNFGQAGVSHALTPVFTKAFSGPVTPGGSADLLFTIDASALTVPLSGLSFSDDLSAMLPGTTIDTVPLIACGGSVSGAGGSLVSFTGPGLAAGESCSFSIRISVDAGAAGGFYENVSSPLVVQTPGGVVFADPAIDTLEVIGSGPNPPTDPTDPPVAKPVPAFGPVAWLILTFLILGAGLRARG